MRFYISIKMRGSSGIYGAYSGHFLLCFLRRGLKRRKDKEENKKQLKFCFRLRKTNKQTNKRLFICLCLVARTRGIVAGWRSSVRTGSSPPSPSPSPTRPRVQVQVQRGELSKDGWRPWASSAAPSTSSSRSGNHSSPVSQPENVENVETVFMWRLKMLKRFETVLCGDVIMKIV